MKIFRLAPAFLVVLAFTLAPFHSFAKPKYGPEKDPRATPLRLEHRYFETSASKNSDFWV